MGRRKTAQDIWAEVEPVESGCWLWRGYIATTGYGHVQLEGHRYYVHRVAYEFFGGTIPAGLQIDHLCRVRHCVNPAHLEPVTPGTNVRRGFNPPAINARKTHCIRGHEFSPENTYVIAGKRRCAPCAAANDRASKERRRALVAAS